MVLGVLDQLPPRAHRPFPPGRNDPDRRERHISQFEAHLVVALAGRAMRDRIRAFFCRDFRLLRAISGRAIDVPNR